MTETDRQGQNETEKNRNRKKPDRNGHEGTETDQKIEKLTETDGNGWKRMKNDISLH